MDKDKEFEKIATLLVDTGFRHRPNCPNNKSCIYCGGTVNVPCIECKQTTALLAAGYGNIKEYQSEIERLQTELSHREEDLIHADESVFYRKCDVALREKEIAQQTKYVYCVMVSRKDTFQLMAQFVYNSKEKAQIMKENAQKVFNDQYVKIERYEVK